MLKSERVCEVLEEKLEEIVLKGNREKVSRERFYVEMSGIEEMKMSECRDILIYLGKGILYERVKNLTDELKSNGFVKTIDLSRKSIRNQ